MKRIISTLVILLFMVIVIPFEEIKAEGLLKNQEIKPSFEWYGDGRAEIYYVSTPEDLVGLAKLVRGNKPDNYIDFRGKTIILKNDIDFEGRMFSGIGEYGETEYYFNGTFDGQNHTIKNYRLQCNNYLIGLFNIVGTYGTVKNVEVGDDVKFIESTPDSKNIGRLVGNNKGVVENCYSKADFKAQIIKTYKDISDDGIEKQTYMAGLISNNEGIIRNCYTTGYITAQGMYSAICSVNYPSGNIIDCYNTGNLKSNSTITAICNENQGVITNCFNTGNIETDFSTHAGGLVNSSTGNISRCYNTGNITVKNGYDVIIGGVVGLANCEVKECFNSGDIKAKAEKSVFAGGVSGFSIILENTYNIGNINIEKSKKIYVGGVAGTVQIDARNCYSTGDIKAPFKAKKAGICTLYNFSGEIPKNEIIISNCFYKPLFLINSIKPKDKIVKTDNIKEISINKMSGDNLKQYLGEDFWIFSEGKLPQLKCFERLGFVIEKGSAGINIVLVMIIGLVLLISLFILLKIIRKRRKVKLK